ncbi:MAG TPA: hypothetical protein DD381_13400 [Lentisphaeria bacterium]|nr:MAG: hypothetical protein A2X47_10985 [Lentisphaerae bacterium GWF2_38_69]HBM17317.1 hypothetical protein [Lentisphaeria bacterium]
MNSIGHDELSISEQEYFDFVFYLASMLAEYGQTVFEIEEILINLCAFLKLDYKFFTLNKALWISTLINNTPQSFMKPLSSGKPDLNKLEAMRKVLQNIRNGKIRIHEARIEMEKIKESNDEYHPFIEFLSWPLLGGGFAVYYGGGLNECITAGSIAVVLYLINDIFKRVKNFEHRKIFEPIAAIVSSILAVFAALIISPLSVPIATLCGMMIILPGFSLTKGLNEIALDHTISGMSRLLGAITTLILMASGVFLGSKIYLLLHFPPINNYSLRPGLWLTLGGIIASICALCVYVKVKAKHIIWVTLVAIVISFPLIKSAAYLGPSLSTGVASFLTALSANIYSRVRNCSDSVIKIPNTYILVPGFTGLNAVVLLINQDTMMQGVDKLMSTVGIAIAIIAGFLIADIIFPPKRIWNK